MRISDWSSDVCSSDLAGGESDQRGHQDPAGLYERSKTAGAAVLFHERPALLLHSPRQLLTLSEEPLPCAAARESGGSFLLEDDQSLLPRREENITITPRSEEHTSELQSLMRISYAVFC